MGQRKVLIVDDEQTVLDILKLQLKDKFEVEVAESAPVAWKLLNESRDYAVVVSDMHMPLVDGVQFLATVQNKFPAITRIIMTADSDQGVAASAVNNGQVFRFLQKPCPIETLQSAIEAGLKQNQLVTVEKELFEETVRGCVNLLVDLLSDIKPLAFGRSRRVKKLIADVCDQLDIEQSWQIKVAAMLSQIGCIGLPDEMLEQLHSGAKLKAIEQMEFNTHPAYGEDLLSKIPRLEPVGRLVGLQLKPLDEIKLLVESETECQYASILATCLEFDSLVTAGENEQNAISLLHQNPQRRDPSVVEALKMVVIGKCETAVADVWSLRVGMMLESDVLDDRGSLLVPRGQVITEIMLKRLQKRSASISSPISVGVSKTSTMLD